MQGDAAGGRDVRQTGGEAGRDRVQQNLDRGDALVGSYQNGRVVGVLHERLGTGGVLLAAP